MEDFQIFIYTVYFVNLFIYTETIFGSYMTMRCRFSKQSNSQVYIAVSLIRNKWLMMPAGYKLLASIIPASTVSDIHIILYINLDTNMYKIKWL